MRRWHSKREQSIMFRRWREEMDKHGYDWRYPPTDESACHCAKGIGAMRKQTPHGHHRHCLLCNPDKYLAKKRRRKGSRVIDVVADELKNS